MLAEEQSSNGYTAMLRILGTIFTVGSIKHKKRSKTCKLLTFILIQQKLKRKLRSIYNSFNIYSHLSIFVVPLYLRLFVYYKFNIILSR